MRKQNLLLTGWLVAPILVVALLCYWILTALQAGPTMVAEPVGAGAGQTGGANAIGELISEHRAGAKVVIVVDDRTGSATPDRPLLLSALGTGWEAQPLTPEGGGRWIWTGTAGALKDGFEIHWTDAEGNALRDGAGRRHLAISSGEQRVAVTELVR